ncbi:hypothetical protein GQ44DRAFT_731550 [Phaeosphaeriaceae sp. PMI808]|nr:hypothetical protein GQ44DRAFT_731550 [Phaeosphaeriaceae sp. PMI808]
MSSAASTSSPLASKKQKHVTTACLNYRKRKIKCDGAELSCSNCSLYSQQCIYQLGVDKRKVSVKDRLAAIEAYAQELERLLTAGGIPLPRNGQASATAMYFQPSAVTLVKSNCFNFHERCLIARFQQPRKDAGGLGDCVGDRLSHVSNPRPGGPLNTAQNF